MDTRMKFTNSINQLSFFQKLKKQEQSRLYAKYTNQIYLNLQDVQMDAKTYKKTHGISKKKIAKHYFNKDGLLDLEEIENALSAVVGYASPVSEQALDEVFQQFFASLNTA